MSEMIDYPKLECPFVRYKNIKGEYVVKDEINPGYEWIYDAGVRAVDKIHGTNLRVNIENGKITSIYNRENLVMDSTGIPVKGSSSAAIKGCLYSGNRGWLQEGIQYGELIGPDINGNLHQTEEYIFVPFHYLFSRCNWISWEDNKFQKTFEYISDWFKNIPSLFSKRMFNREVIAEGLVFYHPDGRKAKLRRDMFDWFEGKRH